MLEQFKAFGEHYIAKEIKEETTTDIFVSVSEEPIKLYEVISSPCSDWGIDDGDKIIADSTKVKTFKDYVIIKEEDIIAFKTIDKTSKDNENNQEPITES